jgi:hypothetical protein
MTATTRVAAKSETASFRYASLVCSERALTGVPQSRVARGGPFLVTSHGSKIQFLRGAGHEY